VRLAEEAAVLDQLSHGRYELAIGGRRRRRLMFAVMLGEEDRCVFAKEIMPALRDRFAAPK
jgi:hypothetical protein